LTRENIQRPAQTNWSMRCGGWRHNEADPGLAFVVFHWYYRKEFGQSRIGHCPPAIRHRVKDNV